MSEGYITDFHNGERKFVKGRLRKDRPLDSFDFNKIKEHNINTKFLEENKDVIKIKNSTYPWPIKKHVKFSLKTLKTHLSRIKRKITNNKQIDHFLVDTFFCTKVLLWSIKTNHINILKTFYDVKSSLYNSSALLTGKGVIPPIAHREAFSIVSHNSSSKIKLLSTS